jgi:uncharacterized membrane protein YcaP (DUF421 family)
MNEYLTIALELSIGFLGLLAMTKFLGKTHLSQITPFDFISALILGELLGNAIYDDEISIWKVLFAILLWGLLIYITIMLTQKANKLRKILEGEPSIVIHKGQFKFKVMKENRMDINQLLSLIRQRGYFSMQEVEYVILEPNGQVSVLPKSGYDMPRKKDLQLPDTPSSLPVALILDGQLVPDNLREAGIDELWLKKQLQTQDITEYKDVFYAEWNKDQPLFVNKYS